MLNDFIFKDLRWESDFDGEDLGYENISAIGIYSDDENGITYYIDYESGNILEYYIETEE